MILKMVVIFVVVSKNLMAYLHGIKIFPDIWGLKCKNGNASFSMTVRSVFIVWNCFPDEVQMVVE